MEESTIESDLIKPFNNHHGLNKYPVGVQFIIWCLMFTISYMMVAPVFTYFILKSYYGTVSIQLLVGHADDLNMMRIAQMIATVISFLVPALIFGHLKTNSITEYALADKGFQPLLMILIPLMIVSIYPLINLSFFVNKLMPWDEWMRKEQGEYKMLANALLSGNSLILFLLNLLTVAIVPAICEEWIFRGTLQRLLSEALNIHVAVIITSIIFSAIHFDFSGFLPRIILGMLLGYIYYYSGSLWACILAHILNNAAQVTMVYLNNTGRIHMNTDSPQMPTFIQFIFYTGAFVALCSLFYHFSQKRKISNFT